MTASSFSCICVLLPLLLPGALSTPMTGIIHALNLTLRPPTLSLNSISTISVTLPSDIPYKVPDTQITIYFDLGFPIDEVAMTHTIDAARNYCNFEFAAKGDVPLPRTEDPFDDNLGYGTAIYVVSTIPWRRITWGILKGILQGLQDFLVDQGRFMEAEFTVSQKDVGFVSRGSIKEAARAPETKA